MPKLITFAATGYTGGTQTFQSNDPDLTLNGDDFLLNAAIVLSGQWTLYDAVGHTGNAISLSDSGGPDSDGGYKDWADWGGNSAFHVRSIQHS